MHEPLEVPYVEHGGDLAAAATTNNSMNQQAPSPSKTAATAMSVQDDYGGSVGSSDSIPAADTEDESNLSLCRRLVKYIVSSDGKEFIACCLAGGLFLGLGYLIETPVERPIPSQYLEDSQTYILNLSLNQPFDGDTVPDWAVALLAIIAGPVLQLMLSYFVGAGLPDVHRTLCINILALSVNDLTTWVLKAYVGYFRPSFYQICQPDETYDYCTNDAEEGYARDSFPSGHASFAFCSMTILSLYLERTFGVSSVERAFVVMGPATAPTTANGSNDEVTKQPLGLEYSRAPLMYRFASMLCTLPLVVATFVSVSRVADNRHHPADIIAGGILGSFIGCFFHNAWFQDPRFSIADQARW